MTDSHGLPEDKLKTFLVALTILMIACNVGLLFAIGYFFTCP